MYFFREVVGVEAVSKGRSRRGRAGDYQGWVEAFAGNRREDGTAPPGIKAVPGGQSRCVRILAMTGRCSIARCRALAQCLLGAPRRQHLCRYITRPAIASVAITICSWVTRRLVSAFLLNALEQREEIAVG